MRSHIRTLVGTIAISLVAGLTAEAQVTIFSENFDTALSPGAAFSQYYGGDCTSYSNSIAPGVGVGGTGGWLVVLNAGPGGSAGYSYMGAQYQNGGVTGNTSANLSDYILSFDAMSTGGSLNIQVQSWTGAGFGGSMTGTLNTAPASPGYGDDLALNGTYTHYQLNLGDPSIWHDNSGFLPNGGTIQLALQLNGGGTTPYSIIMNVDNLMLTMVPEPSSLALFGLGAMGMVGFLRRRFKA